ncbi:MAG TPA: PQQ-binding-like beta-propeller repeat protein, partial [Chloroflexota bacterium]|nr:PQQ-binding-like beta-propeller repeat protein [Chloroflexota bacterium]
LHPAETLWVEQNTVIVPLFTGEIVALDAATGVDRWQHKPETERHGAIGVFDGQVWYVQDDARVAVLDESSGRQIAHYGGVTANLNISGPTYARPALVGRTVVVPMNTTRVGLPLPDTGSGGAARP